MGRPIRIAYVVNKLTTGGIKSLLMSYFRHIDHDRFTIDFVVCEDDTDPTDYSEIERLGGSIVEIAPISNPLAYLSSCVIALKKGGYDIVQACMNSLNVFPLLAAKMARVPIRISYNLSTSHPGESKTIAKNALRPFGNLFATSCTANSELAWNWLFGEKNPSEHVIIPNAIDLDTYHFDAGLRKSVRADMGWEELFIIGHVGRFEYQKNHRFLVEIFKQIHDIDSSARLALVGYGSLKESTFSFIRTLGLENYVFDLGETEDLTGLYNAFDCFVLPSFYEGLPVVGIEAQATGCPCIFSSEVTQETKVLDQSDFLNLSDDVSIWAESILRFADEKRCDGSREVAKCGFESVQATKRLERYYLQQLHLEEEASSDVSS